LLDLDIRLSAEKLGWLYPHKIRLTASGRMAWSYFFGDQTVPCRLRGSGHSLVPYSR